jgi:hydroxymethylglutaryl-CoA synthase
VYVPPYRVDLAYWCDWNGQSREKISQVVGASFRMRGPEQSVYTMAATAVLRLIRNYEVDPSSVGYLALGTESSTDNAVGAIIVKGMLNQALAELGYPLLPRRCEVPEYKHACLGGIYALKGALRYVQSDGRGARAIVVSADIAEYARGSTGEATQGAGAVAMLVDSNAAMLQVDLASGGCSSAYRGLDFRKPFQRFVGQVRQQGSIQDLPLFNGKYSTTCYIDATLGAMTDMLERRDCQDRLHYMRSLGGVFMHRPYRRMPESGLGMAYLKVLLAADEPDHELAGACLTAGVSMDGLREEMMQEKQVGQLVSRRDLDRELYPLSQVILRLLRHAPGFGKWLHGQLGLGAAAMAELGNLYTAALPAWIAAGMEQAHAEGMDLDKEMLAIGYGSGDASEVLPLRAVPGWQVAAARIGFRRALENPITINLDQYTNLHDHGVWTGDARVPADEFMVASVGENESGPILDNGVEYYRYAGVAGANE